jgi:hypothetical protein
MREMEELAASVATGLIVRIGKCRTQAIGLCKGSHWDKRKLGGR